MPGAYKYLLFLGVVLLCVPSLTQCQNNVPPPFAHVQYVVQPVWLQGQLNYQIDNLVGENPTVQLSRGAIAIFDLSQIRPQQFIISADIQPPFNSDVGVFYSPSDRSGNRYVVLVTDANTPSGLRYIGDGDRSMGVIQILDGPHVGSPTIPIPRMPHYDVAFKVTAESARSSSGGVLANYYLVLDERSNYAYVGTGSNPNVNVERTTTIRFDLQFSSQTPMTIGVRSLDGLGYKRIDGLRYLPNENHYDNYLYLDVNYTLPSTLYYLCETCVSGGGQINVFMARLNLRFVSKYGFEDSEYQTWVELEEVSAKANQTIKNPSLNITRGTEVSILDPWYYTLIDYWAFQHAKSLNASRSAYEAEFSIQRNGYSWIIDEQTPNVVQYVNGAATGFIFVQPPIGPVRIPTAIVPTQPPTSTPTPNVTIATLPPPTTIPPSIPPTSPPTEPVKPLANSAPLQVFSSSGIMFTFIAPIVADRLLVGCC